ncbi:MAG: DNA polymerase III subunit gamma and tau [Actinomycetales bacterium]
MSLALYRRYRPESFEDVVGQEHVTAPLMQALRTGRVNHAYLFSGPRGCGKTTSARILARCLNCEQGPTATPCGQCPSCRDLATGGPGSLDVIEIDAASHGGVDDARELRDRVAMAPVRDRYRVYIIDEAHMVSPQGFNALLKVVEEPPEHVKFVFATTEPDKVLQTIRSRTHHYAFRLVPPDVLSEYLGRLCEQEGVSVDAGVLALVVRAGQGSVRDSLSVLDQLIAGCGEAGLDYAGTVALLGYTDSALLDDLVEALAQADGATVFGVVNRVIESGHDPRRFVEDVLERLRDLILVKAMGQAAETVLRAVPPDQLERMRQQAAQLGAAELSRSADVTNLALAEMVGASSPRMHLELLAARLLLPSADEGQGALGARVDRIERRLGDGSIDTSVPSLGSGASATVRPPVEQSAPHPDAAQARPGADGPTSGIGEPARPGAPSAAQGAPGRSLPGAGNGPPAAGQPGASHSSAHSDRGAGATTDLPGQAPSGPAVPSGADTPTATARTAPAPGQLDTERLRRAWPEVLAHIEGRRKATWMILTSGSGVHDFSDGVLRLSFPNQGTARGFAAGQHPHVVADAVREIFNVTIRVEAAAGSSPARGSSVPPAADQPAGRGSGTPASARPDPGSPTGRPGGTGRSDDRSTPRGDERSRAGGQVSGGRGTAPQGEPPPRREPPGWESSGRPADSSSRNRGAGAVSGDSGPIEGGSGRSARGSGQRVVSTTDAWGVPFADEPVEDAPPEDDYPSPASGGAGSGRPRGAPSQASPSASGQSTDPNASPAPSRSPGDAPAAGAVSGAGPERGGVTTSDDKPTSGRELRSETNSSEATRPEPAPPGRTTQPSRYEQMRRQHLAQSDAPSSSAPVVDEPSLDDPDAEDSGMVGPSVVERMLGGRVISVDEGTP